MLSHALYGDCNGQAFGAVGYAICYRGEAPSGFDKGRISIDLPWQDHWQGFAISDHPPESSCFESSLRRIVKSPPKTEGPCQALARGLT